MRLAYSKAITQRDCRAKESIELHVGPVAVCHNPVRADPQPDFCYFVPTLYYKKSKIAVSGWR